MFDNRRFFGVAFVLLAVAVTGCVVTPAQPLTDAGHQSPVTLISWMSLEPSNLGAR